MSNLCSFGVVGAEVLDFSDECRIVSFAQGPVNEVSKLHATSKEQFVFGGNSGVVVSNWMGMKRARVDCATMAVSGKELGKGGMEIVGNERGNNIFFAIWDDKEMASTGGVEVVLPSRTWVNSWLGTVGTGSASFYVSIHGFSFYYVSLSLLVQDYGHGGDRGRGMRRDVLNEGGDDG